MTIMDEFLSKSYTKKFKLEVINFAMNQPEMKRCKMAEKFGISDSALRSWISRFFMDITKLSKKQKIKLQENYQNSRWKKSL
ncbi:MAG: helix-turn-helix domain containing protein [Bifidobacteriaceae bacterium]|jgi:transposase-like protein|nr:helix-turn-helix domain containing protein [Bifidobacteriaceae bacterium]